MEEQAQREAKRARNIIWTAAENYDIEPLFLAFTQDGRADMYLNMIIGLTYKWYDKELIDGFFNQLAGKNQELYEGLFWIGLENALFEKEKDKRIALSDLREEYARESLKRYRSHREYSMIDRIRNGHCREILGDKSGLNEQDAAILHAFSYTKDMTTEQLLEKTKENLWEFFSYRPHPKPDKEGIYFMQKVAGAFNSFGKVNATYVRAKNYDSANATTDSKTGTAGHTKHYLLQFSLKNNADDARKYVEACFGKSMFLPDKQERIERKLCVGNHNNCHLLFTRGNCSMMQPDVQSGASEDTVYDWKNKREKREIQEFLQESRIQYDKNKQYFMKNYAVYHNSIKKLTEKLRICMEEYDETFPEASLHGQINPRTVWKAVYMGNPRVFEQKEKEECPKFSVDILMDASSSRKQMQERIAAQGCVLAKSLEQCGIPSQIYSYCSIRGYTVMHIFKGYDEKADADELFKYVAAGNNRDGLALRAAGYLMEKSPKKRKILLFLTDVSPQDDVELGEGAFYKNKEYSDMSAVEDTIKEVRALKNQGVFVVGIFMGSARSDETAAEIFGQSLVKIKNISEFSDAVGRVIQDFFSFSS